MVCPQQTGKTVVRRETWPVSWPGNSNGPGGAVIEGFPVWQELVKGHTTVNDQCLTGHII